MTAETSVETIGVRRFADLRLLPQLMSVSKTVWQFLALRLAALDVAVGQDQFLLAFEGDELVSVAELAERLSVRPSTVSKMLDRLVDKGWASRSSDADDARRVLVQLSDAGRSVRDAVLAVEAEIEAEVLRDLADDAATIAALSDLDAALLKRLRRLR